MKGRILHVIAALTSAVIASGCGIDVEMESQPESVRAGQLVHTSGTLSVPMCPVSPAIFEFVPFVPVEQLASAPPILQDIITDLCSTDGRFTFPGMTGNGLAPTLTKDDVQFLSAQLSSFSRASRGSFTAADTIPCAPDVTCPIPGIEPGSPVEFHGSAITNVPGSYYNFVFAAGEVVDLCTGGMNAGDPCETDDDCPGSTCTPCGDGASGFCVGGENFLQACDTDMDCPDSICQELGINLAFGIACTATQVTPGLEAPAASPWALASAVLALAALGWLGVRRLQ